MYGVASAVDPAQEPKSSAASTRLGIVGSRWTINDQPTFLLGISYYGGLGASPETWQADLVQFRKLGYNWIRVWAVWPAEDHDVSAIDRQGRPRDPYLRRLQELVEWCNRHGWVVDVTLSRKNLSDAQAYFATAAAHRRAVTTLVRQLKDYRNWYLDLANECNIRDRRYVAVEELAELVQAARRLDPHRLLTASHAGEVTREQVLDYRKKVGVDFLSLHLPRQNGQPRQTGPQVRQVLEWLEQNQQLVPVHLQEPFRRDYNRWQPELQDFLQDLRAALEAGAAGWCFHNGNNRHRPDRQPRRCFDLTRTRLVEQLDAVELEVLQRLPQLVATHRPKK
jgi:hypothetical protein